MTALTASAEVYVDFSHRTMGLVDSSSDDGEKPASPRKSGRWVGTTPGNLYVLDVGDDEVLGARMRLETWDGPAHFDPTGWERTDLVEMEFPSGILGVDSLMAGRQPGVYRLPEGRRWHTRLAWRTEARPTPDEMPEASMLVQFWPVEPR